MAFMNRNDGETKFAHLLDALANCDRRRTYYLTLATCYCTPTAAVEFFDAIQARLNIEEIYLYLDRRTAISIGKTELTALEDAYRDILSIYAVKAGHLFHTKGYCVAAYSGEDLVDGRLAIGSANLTTPGLTGKRGNIETLAIHSDISAIGEFLEFFENKDKLIQLQELMDFTDEDTTDFQYALLTSGLFSHKWSATLASYFSVRYQLNEEARQRAQEMIDVSGFQMDAASIAKPYFHFPLSDWQPNDTHLVRNSGIECYLGHWIPKLAIRYDEQNNEHFNRFQRALLARIDSEMESACRHIRQDYASLIAQRIIEEHYADPTQTFQGRIEALMDDREQLYRIWSRRVYFEFPYDPGDIEWINETFADILRTTRRRKRRNRAMKALLAAHSSMTLEPLQTLRA